MQECIMGGVGGVKGSTREALFYEKLSDMAAVRCLLCPKHCVVAEGRSGFCRVRRNVGGELVATGYGRCSACAVDPIEKKPLYHFYPGSLILSLGTVGCNLHCRFCQNWEIAHGDPETYELTPAEAVEIALRQKGDDRRVIGMAYTYSEPIVWYEFVLEAARLAAQTGLKNVLVTNGVIEAGPMAELLPVIDAMNIDVKSFNNRYYQEVCAGSLEPVLRTVEAAVRGGCHVEVTTLLVTGLNDSDEEMRDLASWLASVDRGIPLHLSRYFPNYRMSIPATPTETLRRCREVASEYLDYVYTGNVLDSEGGTTRCPECGTPLLERYGLRLSRSNLVDGSCPRCGRKADVVGTVFERSY